MSFGDFEPTDLKRVGRICTAVTSRTGISDRAWGVQHIRQQSSVATSSRDASSNGGHHDSPIPEVDRINQIVQWLYRRDCDEDCSAEPDDCVWLQALIRRDQVQGMTAWFVQHYLNVEQMIKEATLVKNELKQQKEKCGKELKLALDTWDDINHETPPLSQLTNKVSGIEAGLEILKTDSNQDQEGVTIEKLKKHIHVVKDLKLSPQGLALLKTTDDLDESLLDFAMMVNRNFSVKCENLANEIVWLQKCWSEDIQLIESVFKDLNYAKENKGKLPWKWGNPPTQINREEPSKWATDGENPDFKAFVCQRIEKIIPLPKGISVTLYTVDQLMKIADDMIQANIPDDITEYKTFKANIVTKQCLFDPDTPPSVEEQKKNLAELQREYLTHYRSLRQNEENDDVDGLMTLYLKTKERMVKLQRLEWPKSLNKADGAVLEKLGLAVGKDFAKEYKDLCDKVTTSFSDSLKVLEEKWNEHRAAKQEAHFAFAKLKMTYAWGYVPWDSSVKYYRWWEGNKWEIYNDTDKDDQDADEGVEEIES